MVLGNIDVVTVIIASAIAGIGSGIGVTLGQALYKAFLEDKINLFLDKKHRAERFKQMKEKFSTAESVINFNINGRSPETPQSNKIIDNILGKNIDEHLDAIKGVDDTVKLDKI